MENESLENLKSSNDIEKKNLDEAKEDIANQLKIMIEATDKKMEQATQHFIDQCDAAAAKYYSVNGFLQGQASLVTANGGTFADLCNEMDWDYIRTLAATVAKDASTLLLTIRDAFIDVCKREQYAALPGLLDIYMDDAFITQEDRYQSIPETARELTVCSILANLQPNLEDMWEFYSHAQSEMNKLHDELNVKA